VEKSSRGIRIFGMLSVNLGQKKFFESQSKGGEKGRLWGGGRDRHLLPSRAGKENLSRRIGGRETREGKKEKKTFIWLFQKEQSTSITRGGTAAEKGGEKKGHGERRGWHCCLTCIILGGEIGRKKGKATKMPGRKGKPNRGGGGRIVSIFGKKGGGLSVLSRSRKGRSSGPRGGERKKKRPISAFYGNIVGQGSGRGNSSGKKFLPKDATWNEERKGSRSDLEWMEP